MQEGKAEEKRREEERKCVNLAFRRQLRKFERGRIEVGPARFHEYPSPRTLGFQ